MTFPYYQNLPLYNQLYQQQLQNMQQQNVSNVQQIQNGGFVFVKDENEFINYPVAPGNSVTFKNENQPYIYTKTLGFSQLDRPILEKFRLVKEELVTNGEEEIQATPQVEYLSLSDAEKLQSELESLKDEINFLKEYIEEGNKEATDA